MAAMQRMAQGKQDYLNPVPTPPGPVQGPSSGPEIPLGAPRKNSDISLPPMVAGIEPKPAQPAAAPTLPSPSASSMIRDVQPRRFRTAF